MKWEQPQSTVSNNRGRPEVDFHGAAIVTEGGDEIPITEEMIQGALKRLMEDWDRVYGPSI